MQPKIYYIVYYANRYNMSEQPFITLILRLNVILFYTMPTNDYYHFPHHKLKIDIT